MGGTALVVGAGVFGSAVASQLRLRDWDVSLIEQHTPAHVRASSGGETRLIRMSHGGDELLTRWALDSLANWRDLESRTGANIFVPTGLVWLVRGRGEWEETSRQLLSSLGVDVAQVAGAKITDLMPCAVGTGIDWLLLERGGGILLAQAAVRTLVLDAQQAGVELVRGRAEPCGDAIEVDGEMRCADRIVWAVGPWLASVFPGLSLIRVTRQDELFFGPPIEGTWSSPPLPAWIDFSAGAYGHGDVNGAGVKCGVDIQGDEVDPDTLERTADPDRVAHARRIMSARFPPLASAPLVGSRTCQYSLTPDSNFIAAPVPGTNERHWIMGGDSGQGFKHAPAFASHVADIVGGDAQPLARFGLTARRSVRGGDMRTAGTRASLIE